MSKVIKFEPPEEYYVRYSSEDINQEAESMSLEISEVVQFLSMAPGQQERMLQESGFESRVVICRMIRSLAKLRGRLHR